MKNFYDFNLDSPQERQEREKLFPELSKFHIALREELSEDEYNQFYSAEKESLTRSEKVSTPRTDKETIKPFMVPSPSLNQAWIQV